MATITATLTEGTITNITNGRHHWTGDEPPEANGTDTGPNPYELLLGSVAACTCITLSLYSRHKGIQLDSVQVSMVNDRIHADDCKDCDESATGYIDRITSDIVIRGAFDDAQRARLAQVAVRCPVHKTLERGVTFEENVVVE